jgi:hypothetical protein
VSNQRLPGQNDMFHLDSAITEWRQKMAADGLKDCGLLDELESHLRDDVDRRVQSGLTSESAFREAARQLGRPEILRQEFSKIGETGGTFARWKYFLQTLAGIQNPTLATNMNSSYPNANLEPRWATYLKSVGFVLPALTLMMVMVVFVLPKLREICAHAGIVWPKTYSFALALLHHGLLISSVSIAGLVFLECYSDRWPRYRRAAFGIGVFVVNAAVLVLISSMVIYGVFAAARFMQHAK